MARKKKVGYDCRVYGKPRSREVKGRTRKWKDWYAIVTLDGEEVQSIRAEDETHAFKIRRDKLIEFGKGQFVADKHAITFAEAADKWLRYEWGRTQGKTSDRSENTYDTYRYHVEKYLRPRFGSMKMVTEVPPLVQDFLDELRGKKLSGSYITNIFCTLYNAFEYGRTRLGQPFNPLRDVEYDMPKKRKRSDEEVPKLDEFRKIAALARPEGWTKLDWIQGLVIIYLTGLAGLRRGEVGGLDCEQINLDGDVWEIDVYRQQLQSGRLADPKYGSKRKVPIDRLLHRILVDYRIFLGGWSGPMFRDWGKRRSNAWVGDRVRAMVEAAGFVKEGCENKRDKAKFSTHAFRHFAGSLWIDAGVPIDRVSDWLGHKSIKTTESVYKHEIEARRNRGVAELHGLADLFPGVQSSERPALAAPAPTIEQALTPPERLISTAVVAIDAVKAVPIPKHAPQWVPYAVGLLQSGRSVLELATEIGVHYTFLANAFGRLGMPLPCDIVRDAKFARVHALRKGGSSLREVASEMGLPYPTVTNLTRQRTVSARIERATADKTGRKPLKTNAS